MEVMITVTVIVTEKYKIPTNRIKLDSWPKLNPQVPTLCLYLKCEFSDNIIVECDCSIFTFIIECDYNTNMIKKADLTLKRTCWKTFEYDNRFVIVQYNKYI